MSDQGYHQPSKVALLTGAGFTKTFGGHLATEMWAAIFNQPEVNANPALRTLMLADLNFESVYEEVLQSKQLTAEEQCAFITALSNAYRQMHLHIDVEDNRKLAYSVCRNFLRWFEGQPGDKTRGFFFTLNQDLSVEKFHSSSTSSLTIIPGLHHADWFNDRLDLKNLNCRIQLPDKTKLDQAKERFKQKSTEAFAYIKLHGSYGWVTQAGNEVMVIGRAKTGIISNEPLLNWFFELFETLLNQPDQKLVVVGYGFGDDHINRVLAEAIQRSRLRLYIISPLLPSEFRQMLGQTGYKDTIWNGMGGYHHGTVGDLCRVGDVNPTPQGISFLRLLGLHK